MDPLTGGKDLRDAWRAAAAGGASPERLREILEAAAATAEPVRPEAAGPEVLAGPDWPVLADEALYGLAGDIVRAFDPHTEADRAAILLSFLAAFANAAGTDAYCLANNTRHELRIWPVLVGATSKGRKGTSWAPVRAVMERADTEWAKERIVSGLSSGEGLIWAVRDEIVKRERVKEGNEWVYADVVVDPGAEENENAGGGSTALAIFGAILLLGGAGLGYYAWRSGKPESRLAGGGMLKK